MTFAHDAGALRRAFDERFATCEERLERDTSGLVLARAGATLVGLPLAEITALYDASRVTRVPGGAPFFAGLAGVRGRIVPVFDLAALLGGGAAAPGARPFFAIAQGSERVGLLVVGPIDYAELPRVESGEAAVGGGPLVRRLVRAAGALCAVVDVPAVVAELAARSGGAR